MVKSLDRMSRAAVPAGRLVVYLYGDAAEGGPEGRPPPAGDRHPGPGDDSLGQGPDRGDGGVRWLELAAQTLRDHAQAHGGRKPGA